MAEANDDNALFAIEVDVDDYADTAAVDNPSASSTTTNQDDAVTVSRTFQSASAFQAQKAAYRAKIDWGNLEAELVTAVPALCRNPGPTMVAGDKGEGRDGEGGEHGKGEKVKLSKKETQLLGYVVGELYFSRQFEGVVDLCQRVLVGCELDAKTRAGVEKWILRSKERSEDV
ncbi:hypothetical protein KC343_g3589 [Hortaea werneckii]|uniref:Uncharacterized protein n=1 Tax=Hortaea werneckii TaxID=91943 RepID=A0A3M7E2T9_HORWE|nr:hypothetical protein KC352_g10571 [Hortaea werneckii]KAI7569663.1 hypothetical protein KC317_g3133 [Hortaea werneckii]KAI7622079.1 hypothetical protein KC346_g3378 [Hortaea werneckii]KAI7632257.1 hypothetical protein KC343_g3589 [Hortaea werneckii]KAI7678298.1 hypothetical protein KC319_g3428 [Hortaea werneckii]